MNLNTLNDAELLFEFTENNNEEAFRIITERYYTMVYAAVLRDLHDEHLAQDACQAAFILLAGKGRTLKAQPSISRWLLRASVYIVSNMKREEMRRKKREKEAVIMADKEDIYGLSPEQMIQWNEIKPYLNKAILALGKRQQEAVIGYYLRNRKQETIAQDLGCSIEAVRMLISRGMSKLRKKLSRKNITVPVAVLSSMLAAKGIHAGPVGLGESCCTAGVAGASGEAAGLAGFENAHLIAKGTMKLMMWSKVKMAVVTLAAAALAGLGGMAAVSKLALVESRQRPDVRQDAECPGLGIFGDVLKGLGDDQKDVVFLIDGSESIGEHRKIFLIKEALEDCLRTTLSPQHRFNVIFFNEEVHSFRDNLVRADVETIEDACRYIETFGVGDLTNAEKGLGIALRMKPHVIFLLSDGLPSRGMTDPGELITAVKARNMLPRTRIETFGFISKDRGLSEQIRAREFLEGLAKENFGRFHEVDLVNKVPLGIDSFGSVYLYHNKSIKVFNPETGKLIKRTGVSLGEVQDGVRDAQGNFCFLLRGNEVTILNSRGEAVIAFRHQDERGSEYIRSNCYRIAADLARSKVYLSDISNNRILVYSKEGRFLGDFGSSRRKETRTYQVADRTLLSDETGKEKTIKAHTSTYTFIKPSSQPGYFHKPRHLVADEKTGHLYVNDSCNKRLQTFDAGMKLLKIIALENIAYYRSIRSLRLGRSGRFYFGHSVYGGASVIKILNPQGGLIKEFQTTSIKEGVASFLLVDPEELTLYVSHDTSDKVKVFSKEGRLLNSFSILQE